MLCDSFSEVPEARLEGTVGDDTDTDLEYEMLDGTGERATHMHLFSMLFSWAAGKQGLALSTDGRKM